MLLIRDTRVNSAICSGSSDNQFEIWSAYDLERMKRMDAYIAIAWLTQYQ